LLPDGSRMMDSFVKVWRSWRMLILLRDAAKTNLSPS
jgi:hypothetical protein